MDNLCDLKIFSASFILIVLYSLRATKESKFITIQERHSKTLILMPASTILFESYRLVVTIFFFHFRNKYVFPYHTQRTTLSGFIFVDLSLSHDYFFVLIFFPFLILFIESDFLHAYIFFFRGREN